MENSITNLTYANIAIVSHSNNDFVTEFGQNIPIVTDWNKGEVSNHIQGLVKIVQSPKHFKKLLKVMESELTAYEKSFGVINLDN